MKGIFVFAIVSAVLLGASANPVPQDPELSLSLCEICRTCTTDCPKACQLIKCASPPSPSPSQCETCWKCSELGTKCPEYCSWIKCANPNPIPTNACEICAKCNGKCPDYCAVILCLPVETKPVVTKTISVKPSPKPTLSQCEICATCNGKCPDYCALILCPVQTIKPSPKPIGSLGGFCGGIAGFPCDEPLVCKLDGTYPDAGGVCVEPVKPSPTKSICEICSTCSATLKPCPSICALIDCAPLTPSPKPTVKPTLTTCEICLSCGVKCPEICSRIRCPNPILASA